MTESSLIEPLESRIAPAAVVTVDLTNGKLTLTGDNGDATVTLTAPDSTHSVLSAGTDTTFTMGTSTGLTSLPLGVFKSLSATFGTGVDTFTVAGSDFGGDVSIDLGTGVSNSLTLDSITAKGGLTVKAGAGDDTVTVQGSGAQVKGAASFDLGDAGTNGNVLTVGGTSFLVGKDFTYTGGAQEDSIALSTLVGIKGSATLTLGTGDATVSAFGAGLAVGKKLSIEAKDEGAGANPTTDPAKRANIFLITPSLAVGGDVDIKTGAGEDQVTFGTVGGKSAIRGKFSVAAGDGQDNVIAFLYGGNAKSVKIDGGDGANTLGFALAGASAGKVDIVGGKDADQVYGIFIGAKAGDVTYDLGDAVDIVDASNPQNTTQQQNSLYSFVVSSTVGSVNFFGGAQTDNLLALNLHAKVAAGTFVNSGAGSMTALMVGFGGSSGPVSILGTTAAADSASVTLVGAQTKVASVDIDTGDGAASIQLQPSLGSLPIPIPIPGLSIPSLDGLLQGWTVKGSTTITTGAASDQVLLGGTGVTFGGGIDFDLGDGDNSVQGQVEGLQAKFLNYTGGTGADSIDLQGRAAIGATVLELGAGANSASFAGAVRPIVLGSLDYKSTALAADADSLTLARVLVAGKLNATFGAGASQVSINDSTIGGKLDLKTGAGADKVYFDTLGYTPVMPLGTTFLKAVTIDLGADDDLLSIGGNKIDQFITTKSTFSVDGGTGANTLTFTAADNQLAKPIETKNFTV